MENTEITGKIYSMRVRFTAGGDRFTVYYTKTHYNLFSLKIRFELTEAYALIPSSYPQNQGY